VNDYSWVLYISHKEHLAWKVLDARIDRSSWLETELYLYTTSPCCRPSQTVGRCPGLSTRI